MSHSQITVLVKTSQNVAFRIYLLEVNSKLHVSTAIIDRDAKLYASFFLISHNEKPS